MDKFAYIVTVTPDGSLLVNGNPAAPTDGDPHSSEQLLTWALEQIRRQWEIAGRDAGEGSLLTVTIDDQRNGGYGRQKTRLRPGQAASIEALRARTGKNLEHWTPPSASPSVTAAAPADGPATNPAEQPADHPTARTPAPGPAAQQPHPAGTPAAAEGSTQTQPTPAPPASAPSPAAQATNRQTPSQPAANQPTANQPTGAQQVPAPPRPTQTGPADTAHTAPAQPVPTQPATTQPAANPPRTAQPPEVGVGSPSPTPAADPGPTGPSLGAAIAADQAAEPPAKKRSGLSALLSRGAKKQPTKPTSAPQQPADPATKPARTRRRKGRNQPAKPAPGNTTPAPTAAAESATSTAAVGSPADSAGSATARSGSPSGVLSFLRPKPKPQSTTAEPASDAPPHPGWMKYTPRVGRPRLPEAEKAAAKERPSSKRTIVTVLITLVVALLLFSAWNRANDADSYVAVCVDQRTSSRIDTNEPCIRNQAAHFRWWWVPAGSSVPAIGAPVDPQQGSFVPPDPESPRRYGYAPQGGVYNVSN